MKKLLFRASIALVIAVVLAAPASPQPARAVTVVCYIDIDATGTGDGSSWANAYTNLNYGISDPDCDEAWVAEGVYKPQASDRNNSFWLGEGAVVYGGFAGTETLRSQRNWDTHITVLSGDIDNNDTTDEDGIVQDYVDIVGLNSYHVVGINGVISPVTSATVLDGFYITGGRADGTADTSRGGGLYCAAAFSGHQCSPTLANLEFTGNYALQWGGGIFNDAYEGVSSPSITDSVFMHNHADQLGGAIYNRGRWNGTSSPNLERVLFDHNSAQDGGGAMYNDGREAGASNPSLTDVTFSSNSVPDGNGGGMFNDGEYGNSNPTMLRVRFEDNSAYYYGGGIYDDGDNGVSSPVMTFVRFENNSAHDGGAMYNYAYGGVSSPSLLNVTFKENSALGNGGAMLNYGLYSGNSSPTLANTTFIDNSASQNGGAMFNGGDYTGLSSPTITNVTFNGNHAESNGGAIYNSGLSGTSHPTLTNVILWGDTAYDGGNEIYNSNATTTISYSVVEDSGGSGGSWDTSLGTDGGHNLDADPKLGILTYNGGFTKTMSLLWGSPAINAGNNAACTAASPLDGRDQRGVLRPQMYDCDIGAVERVPPSIRADFDSDGVNEIGYFRASSGLWALLDSGKGFMYSSPTYYTWGQTGDVLAPADYDGDGRLDPTVRRPPAGGQSAAYLMLLSNTGYDFGSTLTVPAGWPGLGDTPVPGDYNGDGIFDPAIFRGNTGVWIIPLSPNFTTFTFYSWGQSGDKPVAADVDGDLQTDIGYWRPSTGVWGFLQSTQGYSYAHAAYWSWGSSTDKPVMADYDGDGKGDPAVVTPPAGGQSQAYRIILSSLGYDPAQSVTVPAGWPGLNDTPVPGDYDRDGKADAAIWRGNSGVWIIPKSSDATYMFAAWGASGDVPVR